LRCIKVIFPFTVCRQREMGQCIVER
jgi:hypothetical protein